MDKAALVKASKDKDSDWIQFTSPTGDPYYLRRRGLINVLREMKGLRWEAHLSWEGPAGWHGRPCLVFTWPRGRLVINLNGIMDGGEAYPVACGRSAKGIGDVRYAKKHNYLAHAVAS